MPAPTRRPRASCSRPWRAPLPAGAAATGISVYNTAGEPLAWTGRVSDLPPERAQGPAALFVAPDALGLRLVRVQPVVDQARGQAAARLGSVVVEQLLGADRAAPTAADTFTMPASIAPVSVRAAIGDAQRRSDHAFVIPSADGQLLVEAEIAPGDLASARARWRSRTTGWVLAVLGLTLLVCTAPLLDARRRARAGAALAAATAGLVAVLLASRYVLRLATVRLVDRRRGRAVRPAPVGAAAGRHRMARLDLMERRRVAAPRFRLHRSTLVSLALAYAAAGALAASLVWAYDRFLQNIVSRSSFDLLHFSLHPLSAPRLAIGFGLVLLHAGVFWGAALMPYVVARGLAPAARPDAARLSWPAAGSPARMRCLDDGQSDRRTGCRCCRSSSSLGAIGAGAVALGWHAGDPPRLAGGADGRDLRRAAWCRRWRCIRRCSRSPTEAKERLVAEQYGPSALRLRDDLQTRLQSRRRGDRRAALARANS